MSHLHLPDGILPFWLLIGSAFGCFSIIILAINSLKGKKELLKTLPYLGFLAGFMIVAMSIEIVPLFYHVNLASVTGIIVGPSLAFIVLCIVNLFLSFMGHGGITTLFLNTIILGLEASAAWFFFRKALSKLPIFWRAFLATFFSLLLSITLTLGLLLTLNKTIASKLNEDREHKEEITLVTLEPRRLFIIFYGLGTLGIILESLISAFILSYIQKIKPEILKL